MATATLYLRHDPSFARPQTWFLAPDGGSIRVRFREAEGPEHVLDVPLGELRPRRHDEETWIAGPLTLATLLGQVQLVLRGAPEEVNAALRRVLTPGGGMRRV